MIKRVYTDTIKGIEQAEKLQSKGWTIVYSGLFFVDMKQPVSKNKKRPYEVRL